MNLDLQLSELRRSLDVATTKIDGQLAVLLQKSDYAEKHARESAERNAAELGARDVRINAHETRLDNVDTKFGALSAKVYFMAGASTTVGGAIGVVTSLLVNKH